LDGLPIGCDFSGRLFESDPRGPAVNAGVVTALTNKSTKIADICLAIKSSKFFTSHDPKLVSNHRNDRLCRAI